MRDVPTVDETITGSPAPGGRAETPPPDVRRPSTWLPRCSCCGHWIAPPGGAGFGDGKTWCEPCAVRVDLERGEGRPR
jgi:hypothetical protein